MRLSKCGRKAASNSAAILFAKEESASIAVFDNLRTVPNQIAPCALGGWSTLGADGFGRSDTWARLRGFFEVDAESTVIGTLYAPAQRGEVEREVVAKAIKEMGFDPSRIEPEIVQPGEW